MCYESVHNTQRCAGKRGMKHKFDASEYFDGTLKSYNPELVFPSLTRS